MNKTFAVLLVGAGFLYSGPVENLQAGEWYEVPNSHMESVKHSVNGPNMWDVSCVIGCWCGGAYDYKRDKLLAFGGGHGQYSGNEIYAFSLNALTWERINNPSNPPADDGVSPYFYAPDGNPGSRHSANALQYLPVIDRFCALSGTGFYPGGQTSTGNVDCFDFDTKTWQTKMATFSSAVTAYAFSAVDPATGLAYVHGSWSSSKFARYNPATKAITPLSVSGTYFMSNGWGVTAAIDPNRKKMVFIGDGAFVYDLSGAGNTVTASNLNGTGDNSIQGGNTPGFEYDPVSDRFIAWDGGQSVYSLNIDTRVWTRSAGTGANPGSPDGNGTYGRFRYVPSKNVFVVVNAANRNVFIYRHTAAATAPKWFLDMIAKGPGTAVEAAGQRNSAGGLSLSVSPNPARGCVSVRISELSAFSRAAVYDARGRQVADLTGKFEQGCAAWLPGQLPAGIYWVRVEGQGAWTGRKIVLM